MKQSSKDLLMKLKISLAYIGNFRNKSNLIALQHLLKENGRGYQNAFRLSCEVQSQKNCRSITNLFCFRLVTFQLVNVNYLV